MRRQTTIRMALTLFAAAILGEAPGPGPSRARADIILETATLGPDPTPAIGLGGLQWIGARFSVTQSVHVDHIGANLEGASTIFGAIVPLSGPDGLPPMPPSHIESYALAGTTFHGDFERSRRLGAALGLPGAGRLRSRLRGGCFRRGRSRQPDRGQYSDIPASFFGALFVNGAVWLDQPTLSGLRLFVTGTQSVPEPSTWIMTGTGLIAAIGTIRKRSRAERDKRIDSGTGPESCNEDPEEGSSTKP